MSTQPLRFNHFTGSVNYRQRNKFDTYIQGSQQCFRAIMKFPIKHETGNVRLLEMPSGNYSGRGTKKRYFKSALEPSNMLQTRNATVLLFIAQTENY